MEMIEENHSYKSAYSSTSADQYVEGILLIQRLKDHPESCAPCRHPKLQEAGYRCCLFNQHIIVFTLEGNTVHVLAVIHSSRNPDDIDV